MTRNDDTAFCSRLFLYDALRLSGLSRYEFARKVSASGPTLTEQDIAAALDGELRLAIGHLAAIKAFTGLEFAGNTARPVRVSDAKTPQSIALERAKKRVGGASRLSHLLGNITSQAVTQWHQVPPARVLDVERITGVSRHDLRPDLYGPAPTSTRNEVAA